MLGPAARHGGHRAWTGPAGIARGTIDGSEVEVGIELLDGVTAGEVLLCHGGVALQRGAPMEVGA